MSRNQSKSIEELQFEAKLKIIEANEEYETQLYFETMPTIDPSYKYCYTSSNWNIPVEHQSVDAWLRAVIKHMALRLPQHGGEKTNALVVSVHKDLGKYEDMWINYETTKLRKLAKSRVKKAK